MVNVFQIDPDGFCPGKSLTSPTCMYSVLGLLMLSIITIIVCDNAHHIDCLLISNYCNFHCHERVEDGL